MKKNPPISVQGKRPRVAQLNKKLIVAVVGILLMVFLLIVVNSVGRKGRTLPSGLESSLQETSVKVVGNPQTIGQLPQSYGQASEVNTLLQRGMNLGSASKLQSELNQLKSSQAALVDELNTLKNNPSNLTSDSALMNQSAMNSSIFFAGGAPPYQVPRSPQGPVLPSDQKTTKAGGMNGEGENDYQAQNMQAQKMSFLTAKPSAEIYDQNAVQYPASPFILQAGTVIPAILQTEIVSSLPGVIAAIVSQNVYDSINGEYLLIPKGSKLIGEYNSQISYGQSELQAKFLRLIRPDGTSIVLPESSPGVDSNGVSGFEDSVDNHWKEIIGAAVLLTVFNIPAIVAQNQMNNSYVTSTNGSGTQVSYPSMGSTATASAMEAMGQAASQVGSSVANKSLNIQPTITIHPGYQFSVMVTKDIILPPYGRTSAQSAT